MSRTPNHFFLSDFNDWLAFYLSAAKGPDRRLLALRGSALAARRAFYMQSLIRTNPRDAIAAAIPSKVRAQLPDATRKHVEIHIKARGDLFRRIGCNPSTGESRQSLHARIGKRVYEAHTYGKLARTEGLVDVPLEGIAMGSMLALADVPSHALFESPSHVRGVAEAVQSASAGLPPPLNAAGLIRVLVIRVDFYDAQNGVTETECASGMQEVNQRFQLWSRERVSLQWAISPLYRMSYTGEAYAFPPPLPDGTVQDLTDKLHDDAVAMAAAYDPGRYDKIIVSLPRIGIRHDSTTGRSEESVHFGNWIGLGDFPSGDQPARKIWIQGYFDAGVVAHELGHTFGLGHACAHVPSGQSVVGQITPGTTIEYGDPFDTMGRGQLDARHFFGPHGLYTIGWRDRAEVLTIDAPGDYTLKRFDHANAGGVQALVVARGSYYYWLGFRGSFTGNTDLSRGAYVTLCGTGRIDKTYLLDFSPATSTFDDAALDLNVPYTDEEHPIRFEVLEHGGTEADEFLRIRIEFPDLSPHIIEQPRDMSAFVGDTVTMSVRARGSGTLHYDWRRNDVAIPDAADSAQLTFVATDAHAGTYTVIVSNAFGQTSSEPFQLAVAYRAPIRLRRSMYRNNRLELGSVTFRTEFSDRTPSTYTWSHDDQPIAGAEGPTLTLTNLSQEDAGRYVCVATTPGGAARTPFLLKVLPSTCTVAGFGSDADGALDMPHNIGDVVAIGASNQYSVALRAGGDLVAWGRGRGTADLATLDDVVAIAIGEVRSWALRADGTVWEWNEYVAPRQVSGLSDVIAIAGCGGHWIALHDHGGVTRDILGNVAPDLPTPGLLNVADISAGMYHGAALLNDDSVRSWGLPQVFNPPNGNLNDATGIACGRFHTLVLKSDGTTLVIGNAMPGAVAPPPVVQLGAPFWRVLEVAAGTEHSLALHHQPVDDIDPAAAEHRYVVTAWGAFNDGRSSPPSRLGRVFGIAAGAKHSLVIVPFLRS